MPGQFIEAPISTWQSITVRSARKRRPPTWFPEGIVHSVVTVRVVVVEWSSVLDLSIPSVVLKVLLALADTPPMSAPASTVVELRELDRFIKGDRLVQRVRHAQFERAVNVRVAILVIDNLVVSGLLDSCCWAAYGSARS